MFFGSAIGLIALCVPLMAASQFLLGVDYSKQVDLAGGVGSFSPILISTDANGNAYIASGPSVFKYDASGNVVWQVNLSSPAGASAADAAGNVYVFLGSSLQRISSDGHGVTSLLDFGIAAVPEFIAIDAGNRIWVAGFTNFALGIEPIATTPGAFQRSLPDTINAHIFIARLDAAGKAIEYATYLAGSGQDQPSGITVDGTGALIISGSTFSADFPLTAGSLPSSGQSVFLTRFKPDGTGLIYSVLLPQAPQTSPAATPQGEAVLAIPGPLNQSLVLVYAPDGSPRFQRAVPAAQSVAVDAAGNIYAAGLPRGGNAPTRNSIGTCGSAFLSVLSPSGDTVQATWLPTGAGTMAVAGPYLYVAAIQYVSDIHGTSVPTLSRLRLSQNAEATTFPLGCVTDAAVFQIPGNAPSGIAPGEIVSLFGERLGPAQGVQPSITGDAGFPKELSSVQVLFDGQTAPLLYVQDSQINAVAPWSLTSGTNTQVCVRYSGMQTNCLAVPVVASAPAVFTIDGTNAAAVNQDGTINSETNPAPPGSIVAIFATGLGPTTPALADGAITQLPLAQNQFPVTANVIFVSGIGGSQSMPCDVTYYGPAPFEIAGLSQVNVRVPSFAGGFQVFDLQVGDVTGGFSIYTGER